MRAYKCLFNNMKWTILDIGFIVILIFFSLNNTSADNRRNNLNRLLSYNSKRPLIALLLKKNVKTIKTLDLDSDDIEIPEVNSVAPPHDQNLYNLYTILRTTQDNENIDEEAANVFEKTKNILREALRARCKKLDKCVNKCPQKKKYTCTLTCQETYDDYDVCEKPKKKKQCKKSKCGKTMPPSWLLI